MRQQVGMTRQRWPEVGRILLDCQPGKLACSVLLLFLGVALANGAEYEREPIRYSQSSPDNQVSRLQQQLEQGEVRGEYDGQLGWLGWLLEQLDVPESSQMLVFSKTSLQRNRIAPRRPRAVYFNDDVYIGYCQNGDVLEITAADPQLGAVFYTVDQHEAERPTLLRQTHDCLACHASSQTEGVPGHVIRSVFPDTAGLPLLSMGSHRVDQTTPLKDRWGGWYVTGTHGGQSHLGNLVLGGRTEPELVDNEAGSNVTDLSGRLDTSAYPSPHSDIVALMVMEHQAPMQNLITRANFLTRHALWYEQSLAEAFDEPREAFRESTLRRIANAGEPLVKYLLFCDEAELTEPIEGTSSFAEEFAARGPHDRQGRSLRELDLQRRVFRYPCSYLIYSEAFQALPEPVRDYVLRRVWEVLSGRDTSQPFAHLSAAERQDILAILRDTKPDLPAYWEVGVAD